MNTPTPDEPDSSREDTTASPGATPSKPAVPIAAPVHPITHLMVPVEHALDRLVRYENHLYRQLYRAHDRLLAMQAARRRAEAM
jgi:hypothetical protein